MAKVRVRASARLDAGSKFRPILVCGDKFHARAYIGGVIQTIGVFDTFKAACRACAKQRRAKKEPFGHNDAADHWLRNHRG